MSSVILQTLGKWLETDSRRVGQIAIRTWLGYWELCHHEDLERKDLQLFNNASDARNLANYDDRDRYRPLKTAPNLRHGWQLRLKDDESVRQAIEWFYPAMIGMWVAEKNRALKVVHFRETLNRQTGMYRITQKISDDQSDAVILKTCRTDGGCLKTILWQIDSTRRIQTLPAEKFDLSATPADALPLICHEACNLLVAAARETVKSGEIPGEE